MKNYPSSILTQKKNRPIGVTIIAILTIISGILLLILGGSGALVALMVPFTATTAVSNNSNDIQSVGPNFGMILLVTGITALIIGIGYLVVSYGLLKGKIWAWKITIVLTILSIAVQIISGITDSIFTVSITDDSSAVAAGFMGLIIGIAINIIILYYLYRPHVMAFFGKSSTKSADFV